MSDYGYIKLHRELMDKPIWKLSTSVQKVVLITLLCSANHSDAEWEWRCEKFKIKDGQFVTSLEKLAQKVGDNVTIKQIRTALARFEKLGFMANESTAQGRLITIVNWREYQGINFEDNKGEGIARAKVGHSEGIARASNNNVKNVNNDKNDNIVVTCVKETDLCYSHYEINIGMMSSTNISTLTSYLEDGIADNVICAAIDTAVKKDILKWAYVKGILNRCVTQNIKTLAQYQLAEKHHDKSKTKPAFVNKDTNRQNAYDQAKDMLRGLDG